MSIKPKIISETGSRRETSSTIDLVGDLEISKEALKKIQNDVGEFLVEQVLGYVSEGKSPVSGESFPGLSKKYKIEKQAEGLPGIPNMELKGDMLDSLTFKPTEEGVKVGFFGSEAWKADGHLKFSGETNHTPQRRFLPAAGQSYKSDITQEIKNIVAERVLDDAGLSKEDFADVDTKSSLYSVLEDAAPNLSRSQLREATLANLKVVRWLEDLGILDLL